MKHKCAGCIALTPAVGCQLGYKTGKYLALNGMTLLQPLVEYPKPRTYLQLAACKESSR
jgi:hypothetical protein